MTQAEPLYRHALSIREPVLNWYVSTLFPRTCCPARRGEVEEIATSKERDSIWCQALRRYGVMPAVTSVVVMRGQRLGGGVIAAMTLGPARPSRSSTTAASDGKVAAK